MVASAGSRLGRAPVLAKYEVLDELGHGGMATVYRAHDKRLGRDVAIKALHPHLRESREIAHRFSVEAKAVAKLRHPNIVEVFDVSSEDELEQYLVVELVRGPTLRRLLKERGALPPEIAAAFVMELLSGVAHAHACGVVHRDVKPENVLVEHRLRGGPASGRQGGLAEWATPVPTSGENRMPSSAPNTGERVAVKLTDFGIAKLLDAQGVTSTGQVLGSPAHMAPEQIEGGDVDGRADVFGLGVLLYECMVGHLPFMGNNPAQVLRRVLDGVYPSAERERPTIGKTWSQILDRALARTPEGRYDDATAMREAVASELARLGMGTPRIMLEAWLDDPEGWTKQHDKGLIDKLCQLGAASRKKSAAVAAAADYNRALAYAPNDPVLLRVVSSMQRSEARVRFLRRAGPLVLGALVLGSGTYAITKSLKSHSAEGKTTPSGTASVVPRVPTTNAPVTSVVVPSASVSSAPPGSVVGVSTRTIATPTVVPVTKPTQRTFQLSTRPPFGVRLLVDGAPAPDPDVQKTLTLDDRAHTLVFSCTEDLCVPKTVVIPEGTKDEALSVELSIANAKLFVDGDPSHSYGVLENPQLSVSGGQSIDVPMGNTSGRREAHVFDRTDPSVKSQAIVLTAGKRATVSFKAR